MKISKIDILNDILSPFNVSEPAMSDLLNAIEKILSDGFVRKELYKEKLTELSELRESLSTAREMADTAEIYKNQLEESAANRCRNEDLLAGKLKEKGVNPKYLGLLVKEADFDKTGIDDISDGLKSVYPNLFGVVSERAALAATPPFINSVKPNPWLRENLSLDEQTKLYRQNPDHARNLASSAGVVLK